jgi:hypothetical protein
MAKHAARVGGIDFNRFRYSFEGKRRTRQKIANDGLQMAVGEPGMRLERDDPGRNLVTRLSR